MPHGLGVPMLTLDRHELITLDAQVVIMGRRDTMPKNLAAVALAIVKIPLGHADTPGGVLAWQNPEGADILVTTVTLNITAIPTTEDPLPLVAAGFADDGTTVSATLVGGENVGTAPTVLTWGYSAGIPAVLPAGRWLTVSGVQGSMAGLAGFAYVDYHLA